MSESKPLPVVDYLKIPEDSEPYLEGYRCKKCGATYLVKEMFVLNALQGIIWKLSNYQIKELCIAMQ